LPVVKQGLTLHTDLTLEAFVLPGCYAAWGLQHESEFPCALIANLLCICIVTAVNRHTELHSFIEHWELGRPV